jgi:hypothetical protein
VSIGKGRCSRVSPQGLGGGGQAESNLDLPGEAWPPPLPPWAHPPSWRAVTAALDHHLRLPCIRHHRMVRKKAGAILDLIRRLDRPMDALARATCPQCENSCCRRATLWYDFVDLLVMGINGQPWPAGQPMRARGETCRYLGQAGCRLPRIWRPWICTWYLCPRQMEHLNAAPSGEGSAITRRIAEVKLLRKALEGAFIHAAMTGP